MRSGFEDEVDWLRTVMYVRTMMSDVGGYFRGAGGEVEERSERRADHLPFVLICHYSGCKHD